MTDTDFRRPGWFYDLLYATVWCLSRLTLDLRVSGIGHIPRSGAFLLVGNHISHFDPPLITTVLPRHMTWVVAGDLYVSKLMGAIFDGIRSIPVNRASVDRQATKKIVRALKAGAPVGIFPEGGIRQREGSLLFGAPLEAGMGSLARMSGVPLVPMLIVGADKLYRASAWWPGSTQIFISVGPPLCVEECGGSQEACQRASEWMRAEFSEIQKGFGLQEQDFPMTAQQRWGQETG